MSTSESEPEIIAESKKSAVTATAPSASNEQIYQQRQLRWPVLLVTLFWIAYGAIGMLELPMFTGFLARSAILVALILIFSIWWLIRGPLRLAFRFLVLGWAVACGTIATLMMHRSVLAVSIFFLMLPILFTAWTVWLLVARLSFTRTRLTGMLVIAMLLSIPGTLVRMEGLRGDGRGDFHWRWSRSAEEKFALSGATASEFKANQPATEPLVSSAEDWTGFRGPNRDATVPGVKIETTWENHPPTLRWRTRVGPAWSSMAIVGGHLYTQEQRGEMEVVSCFDADTGQPLWIHGDPLRFDDPLGGPGPRATPQFADGRIYALGAKGRLNCLDAVTGEKHWSQDIVRSPTDALPNWGYSGSPLVIDGRVIVFAGGKTEKALLAYDAATGKLDWKAVAGLETYSSPQAVVLQGQPQVLLVGDEELAALEPASGKIIWRFKHAESFGRPVVQPRLVGDSKILVSFLPDAGVSELEITRQADSWNVTEVWNSHHIKPDYSDFVHYDGHIYGFDGSIFCCVNLDTGKRHWKGGRYGAGQVLLLSDQPMLLVLTEQGEVVLVEPNPAKHHELARFQAIHGKTWNHPVISRDKLFVRNAEEMACFELNTVAK